MHLYSANKIGQGERDRRTSLLFNLECESIHINKYFLQGAWVAQLVEHLTSAQVMITRYVSSSPALGSVLTARSLKPASDSVLLSLCSSPTFTLSLTLKTK